MTNASGLNESAWAMLLKDVLPGWRQLASGGTYRTIILLFDMRSTLKRFVNILEEIYEVQLK